VGQGDEVLRVAAAQLGLLAALRQLLERVLADRLEHPEAIVRAAKQALLDE
jgi:hypothetical protein